MRSTRRWRCSRWPSSVRRPRTFAPALSCIARSFGEGGRGAPYKAYEWNKMKTPTRILVGGAEATSAFVLSALVHARQAMRTPARSA